MLKKGLAVIAVPFLFQAVFLAALWRSRADSEEAQAWAIHTKDVIAQAEALARYVMEAQASVRGLILSQDLTTSAAYEAAARLVPGAADRLVAMVEDNPPQRTRAGALNLRIRAYMAALEEAHRLAVTGRGAEAADRVRSLARGPAPAAIRSEVDEFLAQEERLDLARRATLKRARRRENQAIGAAAAVSLVVALAMVVLYSRGLAMRVDVLVSNARRLAAGEPLAAPVGGRDEISRLDAVFHAMARALAEKDRENEMFIYSVSHDLRSPLVNLQGFSKELALTCDDLREALAAGGVPEATRARVETLLGRDMDASIRFIRSAVTRLSSIIDSLLRLSRAGRVELSWQAVDVASAVARITQALRSTTAERKAEVVVGDLPPAWGDPAAVEQVFGNLIGNALNYLDPVRPGRVEVGVCEADDGGEGARPGQRTYFVRDNGLGIPEAYRAKLFQAFQRLHPGSAPGEGIGLALVRRTVERLGGRVWAESEEGAGSTFYVTLPEAKGDGPPAEVANGGDAGSGERSLKADGGPGAGTSRELIWPWRR